jgi:hypothetical protein
MNHQKAVAVDRLLPVSQTSSCDGLMNPMMDHGTMNVYKECEARPRESAARIQISVAASIPIDLFSWDVSTIAVGESGVYGGCA